MAFSAHLVAVANAGHRISIVLPIIMFLGSLGGLNALKQRTWRGPSDFFGSPPTERVGAHMTSCRGMLYIFGGHLRGFYSSEGSSNQLYQWNPSTSEWTDLTYSVSGTPPPPRFDFGFTSTDGKLYVFGGASGGYDPYSGHLNDVYELDAATLEWSNLGTSASGDPPASNVGVGLTYFSGSLYAYGGYGTIGDHPAHRRWVTASGVFEFDLSTLAWKDLAKHARGKAPEPRYACGFAAGPDGKLYVFGGLHPNSQFGGQLHDGLHTFDTVTMSWKDITNQVSGPFPASRGFLGFTKAANGKLYMFGGEVGYGYDIEYNDLYQYDPLDLAWTNLGPQSSGNVPEGRNDFGFASVGSKLFVLSGSSSNIVVYENYINDFHEYDLETKVWTDLSGHLGGSGPEAAYGFGLAAGNDERVYHFGGIGNSGRSDALHRLDPISMTWTDLSGIVSGSSPSKRYGLGLTSVNTKLYLFGGYGDACLNDLYELDLITMEWISLTNNNVGKVPSERYGFGFASINGNLYVFGGKDCHGNLSSELFKYDTSKREWTDLTARIKGTFPSLCSDFSFASMNDKLYIFGGRIAQVFFNQLFELDPSTMMWTNLSSAVAAHSPSPRSSAGFASAVGRLWVFGGNVKGTMSKDLYSWDPSTMTWSDQTGSLSGSSPFPRSSLGLLSAAGKLWVIGGYDDNTNALFSDLYGFSLPQTFHGGSTLRTSDFVSIFDWDTVVIDGQTEARVRLELCTGVLPCTLSLRGQGSGAIRLSGDSFISCLGDSGCTGVSIHSVYMGCEGKYAMNSVIVVQGATLMIQNSTFSDCTTTTDGGVITSSHKSIVMIQSSTFQNLHSNGFGSAVRAIGSQVSISYTDFLNCSSKAGGGAIWASAFEIASISGYSSMTSGGTTLSVAGCTFRYCSSSMPGGAVLVSSASVTSSQASVNVHFFSNEFSECSTMGQGGAIASSGGFVNVLLVNCSFVGCTALGSGGAISAENFSVMAVVQSTFTSNSAEGNGGGALHIRNASMQIIGSWCSRNKAPDGGGGALFWEGDIVPTVSAWCPMGMWSLQASDCITAHCPSNCVPCPAGTYQTGEGMISVDSCVACNAGTYSTTQGLSVASCLKCPAGTYSTALGANHSLACGKCDIGWYSISAATVCSLCWAGKFSTNIGATSCISCFTNFSNASLQPQHSNSEPSCIPSIRSHVITRTTHSRRRGTWQLQGKYHQLSMDLRKSDLDSKKGEGVIVSTLSLTGPAVLSTVARLTNIDLQDLDRLISVRRSNTVMVRDFCGPNNFADYGHCLASPYRSLVVTGLPTSVEPAYSGIQFTLSVKKLDFYNQTVSQDNSSLLQILTTTASNSNVHADPSFAVSGMSIDQLEQGQATFSIAIRPLFTKQIESRHLVLARQPRIYLQGVDSTFIEMTSEVFEVFIANGSSVCPRGYVLVLDPTGHGTCLECSPGTYSISPLAGATAQQPSCWNCPATGNCKGGSDVDFSMGSWIESDGIFRLVGCPPGHQLVNAVDGAFSQDVQNCRACGADQYILDSNNSMISCETCPTGAVCDGNTLKGRTPGSVWKANMTSGLYYLESCPIGYLMKINSQESQLCSAWSAPIYTVVKVIIPIVLEDFNASKQASFVNAIASAAGVKRSRVMIASISTGRRSSLGATQVISNVAADNSSAAHLIDAKLESGALSTALGLEGLPRPSDISLAIVDSTSNPSSTVPLGTVLGSSLAGIVVLVVIFVQGRFLFVAVSRKVANRAFLTAFADAKSGDRAVSQHLPFDLRKEYTAIKVLGKGAFGIVVQARKNQGGVCTAVKLIVPDKGCFDDKEMRQLKREGHALKLFTQNRCQGAVQLFGMGAVHIQSDLCWFLMELADGDNMETVIKDSKQGPIDDMECISAARSVLAALKVLHSEGLVHRDIKPANIVRCKVSKAGEDWDGESYEYKLVDFGTVLGVDEKLAMDEMMTMTQNRKMGAGTPPYMSPEMFKEPESAMYSTDLWSLGVTLFELVTSYLPFEADNEYHWCFAIAGNIDEKAPSVLDKLDEGRRSKFDNNLAKVIAKALEKKVINRFSSVDEMHDAVYRCLINRGEAYYSAFISYRVASEAPLARLLFDDLNHSVTPGGHRVTIYWDAHRLIHGDDWEEGFASGLLNSLCFFPILSYGSTAPLATLPRALAGSATDWETSPCGRARLQGTQSDWEDNVLKELLIAGALLERKDTRRAGEGGLLQLAYPVLVGRQHPEGHPEYPKMGSFFEVQGGGGKYPQTPSPPTNKAVIRFLQAKAAFPPSSLSGVASKTVESVLKGLTVIQGCQLWDHPPDLEEVELTKEQQGLVGKGCAGPAVDIGGVVLTPEQRQRCRGGLDERQLRMLKAQVRAQRHRFHEIIDRAVESFSALTPGDAAVRLGSDSPNLLALKSASNHAVSGRH